MTVERNSIFALIGPSGCGKTTLLSCILGMSSLDTGAISVLGHLNKSNKRLRLASKIGYMPQEMALVGKLTVKETIFFFGKIFAMDPKKIEERFQMISELFELPPDDRRVENCSGGEKRRISMAAAIIHEPELLILDEPTVGLDPLLRETIWNYLRSATRCGNLTVIITTHYIKEAQQADRVGLMRNGRLLAEDSPENILSKCEVETLDEAFVVLSAEDEKNSQKIDSSKNKNDGKAKNRSLEENDVKIEENSKAKNIFRWGIICALMEKLFIQQKRQPGPLVFLLLLPLLLGYIGFSVIGRNLTGIKLAIIDGELENYENCFNSKLVTSQLTVDGFCHLEKISCDFLAELDGKTFEKISYESFDDAYRDAKFGELSGIIEIRKNFSESLMDLQDLKKKSSDFSSNSINVHLDQTNLQVTLYKKREILFAFQKFTEKTLVKCGKPRNLLNSPVKMEEPIFGSFNGEQRVVMVPKILNQVIFFNAVAQTITVIISERSEGFWNRSILAGVRSIEIALSQALFNSIISIMQTIGLFGSVFSLGMILEGGVGIFVALLLVNIFAGLSFGLLLSILSSDFSSAIKTQLAMGKIMLFISGAFWPIEGMPTVLKFFSYVTPITLPAMALRNVMLKGFGLTHRSVYTGISVSAAWLVTTFAISVFLLRGKKYSRNL